MDTLRITVLCTASTLTVMIWWPGSNGAWLVLTVSSEPGGGASVRKTLHRIAGTIDGVAIAASWHTPRFRSRGAHARGLLGCSSW